jgi:hypothetical protein
LKNTKKIQQKTHAAENNAMEEASKFANQHAGIRIAALAV